MLIFLNLILIIFSILFFLIGYAFLTDKAEDILMWSFTGKVERVKDREGYKKQQGRYSVIMGVIFLLVPVSIYLINRFDINKQLLYLWYVVLAGTVILNAFQTRRYFK